MKLFIAEKPSLARAIAEGIGSGKKENGYISLDNGNTIVTWCFGHILEQLNPDEYSEAYNEWKMEDLPIIPNPWKLKIKKDASAQFKIIKGLVAKTDCIVNAGDPDREGQLLVDEVLEYLGNPKPVQRILLNALDSKSVKQALDDLRRNEDFVGLKNSALARSRADWLVGMNLSRAYTIAANEAGYTGAVTVGRVQTPTMALVVRREKEIANFKPVTHYQAAVTWKHDQGDIPTTWVMSKDMDGLDSENRLLDRGPVDDLIASITGKTGRIQSVETTKKKAGQRLPYSLSALQIEAGRRYSYNPQQVLNTMQSLYEKKFTTYPRSDCDYLPENQFSEAAMVLGNLQDIDNNDLGTLSKRADMSIHSRAWNDKKISAHHAIIPTTMKCNFAALTQIEQNLYLMVAQAYIAQFFPVHTYESTKIIIECEGQQFSGTGKRILDNGWKDIYKGVPAAEDDKEKDVPVLPAVNQTDPVAYKEGKVQEKITKPPTRFTEATLLKAMKEIYKYVKDDSLKDELKECSGIGTEATRAGIIEALQSREFLRLDKKYLMPTEKAEMAVKVLPEEITYPDTTALWEKELESVSEGALSLESFSHNQEKKIDSFLAHAKEAHIEAPKNVVLCPNCGKAMLRHKGKNGFFWGCSGYPNCKTIANDKKGKPDFSTKKSSSTGLQAKCPICGKQLRQIKGEYGTFWGCEDRACKASFSDHKDNPVITKCPNCGKGYLRRFKSKKKRGQFYWSCTEHCGKFYNDKNGLPEI